MEIMFELFGNMLFTFARNCDSPRTPPCTSPTKLVQTENGLRKPKNFAYSLFIIDWTATKTALYAEKIFVPKQKGPNFKTS
jgi:hypothetical protein